MSPLLRGLLITLALTLPIPIAASDKPDVVYHLSEPERATFVLTNIGNHIEGVGGADRINIVLVMHGPAVRAFIDIEAPDRVRNQVSDLQGQGVSFNVCGNTLKAMGLGIDELLGGMIEVDQGGVTRIGELQSRGYIYIRP